MGVVLVVGCASFDTIHIEREGKRETVNIIGGAGLYTALAAARQGAEAILYGPRPEPMTESFQPVEEKITWLGPHVSPDQMPGLEIVHHGGGRATLLGAAWGAESLLEPDCLPEIRDFDFDIVHIAALSAARKQLRLAEFFAESKQERLISAGTYARAITDDTASVRALMDVSDLFFMNSNEANLLFGDSAIAAKNGKLLFVTGGNDGVTIYQDGPPVAVPAVEAQEFDPTGAGDTFCGGTLAEIADGNSDPVSAAKQAVKLASGVIERPGPAFLLSMTIIALIAILFCATPVSARTPDLGNPTACQVGTAEFHLKNQKPVTAGKAFVVKLNSGQSVLITPLHLIGPSGGFPRQLNAAQCQAQFDKVYVYNLYSGEIIAEANQQLLSNGDISQAQNADLRGDLLAFKLKRNAKLQPLTLSRNLPREGSDAYLLGEDTGRSTRKIQYHEGSVIESKPGYVAVKLKRALRLSALSGSPVVDSKGEVIGMLYGSAADKQTFYLNPGASISQRLNRELK